MRSIDFSTAEFVADRSSAQERLVEHLQGVVGAFLSTGSFTDLRTALSRAWDEEFRRETSAPTPIRDRTRFLDSVESALENATSDSDVHSTSLALSLAVLNDTARQAVSQEDDEVVMEWVAMRDDDVRASHRLANGQQRPVGESFSVGTTKMPYPGWMGGPVEEWINCRCAIRPARPNEFAGQLERMRSNTQAREVSQEERDRLAEEGKAMDDGSYPIANCEDLKNAIQAIGRAKDPEATKTHIRKRKNALDCPDVELPDTWSLTAAADVPTNALGIFAIPAFDEAVHEIGGEEKHATLVYFGDVADGILVDNIGQWVAQIAADAQPFTAQVDKIAPLGDEGAQVWLLRESDLEGLREGLMANDDVQTTYANADVTHYPEFAPHVTIGYDDVPTESTDVAEITFDRLAVWHGEDRYEYPLGGDMPENETDQVDEINIDDIELAEQEVAPDRVPWHGVLAPEGVASGDGRMFAVGSLRHRDLPLPLTWQKTSAEGHDQNVTVATIEWMENRDGMWHGGGHFLTTQSEADEVVGLISEFGKFGVSIDADDATFDFDEETEAVVFSDARVCSACIVSIPAFAEAYVALGPGEIPQTEEVDEAEEDAPTADDSTPSGEDEGVAAAGETVEAKRGPGWVTHPEETRRLHRYWTQPGQPGYAKIAWGSPGDFNRCRVMVGEKIATNSPEDMRHLNAICAEWHHDALGIWPGQHAHASEAEGLEFGDAGPAVTLVAAGGWSAPSAHFAEPTEEELPPGEGIVITDEGRVFGLIAEWGVCHVGLGGACTEAPASAADYAYFRTGEVATPDGPVKVGALTYATGHADPRLAAQPAAAHYDDTGSAWAYVAVGENDRGIWFSGMLRPEVDENVISEVKASGRLSGDWRRIGNTLELVAALSVNTPGFPVQKPQVALAAGAQLSLVAAGVVKGESDSQPEAGADYSRLAALVVDEIEARSKRRERMSTLQTELEG